MPNYKRNSNREFYNPLRGLSMEGIISMEDAARRGDFADIQWLWDHMAQTDVMVAAAVEKRLGFIDSLDWEIKAAENADPILAQEQADVLRYAYDRIENLQDAARSIAKAFFTGYSHLLKIKTGYGPLVSKLEYIEPWFWVKNDRGEWRFNPTADGGERDGQFIDPRDFIIADMGKALYQPICRNFFSKQLALADWDVGLETSANQAIFFIGPPGATEDQEREYQTLAESYASNLRGYLPSGADVKMPDPGARSKMPYFDRIQYADKQIVMAATHGQLTMLTESGSGTLAGSAHADGMTALAAADAARISEVFQRQFDKHVLKAFFPKQAHVAYFKYDLPKAADSITEITELVSNLSWAGYRVNIDQLSEKLGLKLEMLPQQGQQ